ncbi:hypothetical protein [Thermoleptolyngbya sp.]|jgi:hypothetical protein
MRYILMLQLVAIITLNLVMGSALFAWLQSRTGGGLPDAAADRQSLNFGQDAE